MNYSLNELMSVHPMPGVSLWKKDSNSVLIDVNQEYTRLFGFKCIEDAIGKTDADVPCQAAEIADIIQKNDREVLKNNSSAKFLEILQVAYDKWKMLLIVKTPYYENNKAIGTSAYCVEIPYLQYKQFGIDSLHQASYRILDANPLLTQKETECLFYFLRKKTMHEISGLLGVAPRTVEMYLSSIKSKMACDTDLQLIEYAVEKNYLNVLPESLLNCHPSLPDNEFQLSKRQFDCLYHLVKGMTIKEIGKQLGLSPRTVEEHINILKKRLNCSSRSSLISKAFTLRCINEKL